MFPNLLHTFVHFPGLIPSLANEVVNQKIVSHVLNVIVNKFGDFWSLDLKSTVSSFYFGNIFEDIKYVI